MGASASFFGGGGPDLAVAFEPPIRDGARLNNSGARLYEGARLGDSCAGPSSGTRDASVDEGSCEIVNAAATVSARAVTVAIANQQQQGTMFFHRYLQTFLLAWNRRFLNDTCYLTVGTTTPVFCRYLWRGPTRYARDKIRRRFRLPQDPNPFPEP